MDLDGRKGLGVLRMKRQVCASPFCPLHPFVDCLQDVMVDRSQCVDFVFMEACRTQHLFDI